MVGGDGEKDKAGWRVESLTKSRTASLLGGWGRVLGDFCINA